MSIVSRQPASSCDCSVRVHYHGSLIRLPGVGLIDVTLMLPKHIEVLSTEPLDCPLQWSTTSSSIIRIPTSVFISLRCAEECVQWTSLIRHPNPSSLQMLVKVNFWLYAVPVFCVSIVSKRAVYALVRNSSTWRRV